MEAKPFVAPAACLLAGVAIGHFARFSRSPEPDRAPALVPVVAAASGTVLAATPVENARRPAVAEFPPEVAGSREEPSGVSYARVPVPLLSALSAAASTHLPGDAFFEADDLVENALGITGAERDLIEGAWLEAAERAAALEVRAAAHEEREDGSVRVTVPDLSASVAPLGGRFAARLHEILGPERAAVVLATKRPGEALAPGGGSRSYTVNPEETGDGGWRYHIVEEDAAARRVWVGEAIPDRLRRLTGDLRIEPLDTE